MEWLPRAISIPTIFTGSLRLISSHPLLDLFSSSWLTCLLLQTATGCPPKRWLWRNHCLLARYMCKDLRLEVGIHDVALHHQTQCSKHIQLASGCRCFWWAGTQVQSHHQNLLVAPYKWAGWVFHSDMLLLHPTATLIASCQVPWPAALKWSQNVWLVKMFHHSLGLDTAWICMSPNRPCTWLHSLLCHTSWWVPTCLRLG